MFFFFFNYLATTVNKLDFNFMHFTFLQTIQNLKPNNGIYIYQCFELNVFNKSQNKFLYLIKFVNSLSFQMLKINIKIHLHSQFWSFSYLQKIISLKYRKAIYKKNLLKKKSKCEQTDLSNRNFWSKGLFYYWPIDSWTDFQ